MPAFIFKLLAMSTMVIDHISIAFLDNNMTMRNIGRLAFLTYAFLMAEAYFHLRKDPRQVWRHVFKLVCLCMITEIPFDLFESGVWIDISKQSVLPTLTLGFAALAMSGFWQKQCRNRYLSILGSGAIYLLACFITYRTPDRDIAGFAKIWYNFPVTEYLIYSMLQKGAKTS